MRSPASPVSDAGAELRALVVLLAATGLRMGETIRLDRDDVGFDRAVACDE